MMPPIAAPVSIGGVVASMPLGGFALGAIGLAVWGQPDAPAQQTNYKVRRAGAQVEELLAADNVLWSGAQKITWGPDAYATSFRALWRDEGLIVRFDAVDSSPWHTLTDRDDQLWNEEVVEIFIDPDGDGCNDAELEINPANVVCDLQVFEGSPNLRSDIEWDLTGLRSTVDRSFDEADRTVGWTAIALLPWSDLATLDETDVPFPPRPGDRWKFNVSRIKRPGGPEDPEREAVYAAWSQPPGASFHAPEVFRDMEFVR